MKDMKIYVRNNDISKALRILKKKLHAEGDAKKLREKQHFISAGEQKRLEEKAGRRRWLKKQQQIEKNLQNKEQAYLKQRKRSNANKQSNNNFANR